MSPFVKLLCQSDWWYSTQRCWYSMSILLLICAFCSLSQCDSVSLPVEWTLQLLLSDHFDLKTQVRGCQAKLTQVRVCGVPKSPEILRCVCNQLAKSGEIFMFVSKKMPSNAGMPKSLSVLIVLVNDDRR